MRRLRCLLFGHRPVSQRGSLIRSSHVVCSRCREMVRAPMEPIG